ncbi:DUF2867 domain-containing protein [Aquimarina sp. 2304DJ70-9]|uniref:DUF2867 domain-containing protein n=1 Tax=Aquimarina penaris TaxID=3231044 RepID=UPI0034619950
MKIKKIAFPENSMLSKIKYDYADSYFGQIQKENNNISIEEISKAFLTSSPRWIDLLMVFRNKIVSIFGLKTGNTLHKKDILSNHFTIEKGKRIGIFKVYEQNEGELILGEDDHHLNFRVSLLLEPADRDQKELIISTIVKFNNTLGRLYFLPVKPFHKLIVKNMLRNTIKEIHKLNTITT